DGPDSVTVSGQYEQVNQPSERCRTTTAYRDSDRIMGYEVTYRYGGREYTTRMDHDPGQRLRVRVDTHYSIQPFEEVRSTVLDDGAEKPGLFVPSPAFPLPRLRERVG